MSEQKKFEYSDLLTDEAKAEQKADNERFANDLEAWRKEKEEQTLDLTGAFEKAIAASKEDDRKALERAIEAAKADAERRVREEYANAGKASIAMEKTAQGEEWAAFARQIARDVQERHERMGF